MKNRVTSFCICAALCVIIGIAFTACGGGSAIKDDMTPSETVSAFLDAFKAQDEETMNKVYAGDGNDFVSAYEESEGDDETTQALKSELMTRWLDFDYEIKGEEIAEDGKTATVDLAITTYDMKTVFNNFYTEFMGKALEQYSGNSNNVSEEDYNKMALEILQEELSKVTEKEYTGEATLSLTKKDDRWVVDKIDESNNEFLNAITGGLMDVLMDVVNTMNDMEGENSGSENSED